MTEKFKREPRYIVFKLTDVLKYLMQGEFDSLMCIGGEIALARSDDGKPPFNAVVVEQDWPEFDPVWAMIEARMTGQPTTLDELDRLKTREKVLCEALKNAHACITLDRDSLAQCHTRPSTGELDQEGREGVAEYDAVLAGIDFALQTGD